MTNKPLATRLPGRLRPNPARVIAQLFVPGHYLPDGRDGRASGVVEHILELSDEEVSEALGSVVARFDGRHRDLLGAFERHADRIGNRLDAGAQLSDERWLLLGATFTHEYSVEAAGILNPSAVALPDQSGAPPGALRFAISVRQVGEGHRSSTGFRTGVISRRGAVSLDPPAAYTTAGAIEGGAHDAAAFRGLAQDVKRDQEATGWVLDGLSERFTIADLDERLGQLEAQRDTRRNVAATVRRLRDLASRTYTATFPATSALSERVLVPATSVESNGIEDARFVRFVDDEGAVTYHATYTAFDGLDVVQQLLSTEDLVTFRSSPLVGAAAANKGMALFPRKIDGRFAALSRFDGSGNAVAFSDDLTYWPSATPVTCPSAAWEAVQVGNCGPPIETDHGWLVLTHGVGPMRTYSIGAWLLDRDDPTQLIGHLRAPLLSPQPDEQDGYVPNVVYSCGGLVHHETLLIPYGIGDSTIGFATAPLAGVIEAMEQVRAAALAPG